MRETVFDFIPKIRGRLTFRASETPAVIPLNVKLRRVTGVIDSLKFEGPGSLCVPTSDHRFIRGCFQKRKRHSFIIFPSVRKIPGSAGNARLHGFELVLYI